MSVQILNEDFPDDVIVALLPTFRHEPGEIVYSREKLFRMKIRSKLQDSYPSMSSSRVDGIVFRLTDPPKSGDLLYGYTIGSSREADLRIKMPGISKILFRIHFNPDNGVLLVTNVANKPLSLATTRRDNWRPQETFVLSHEFRLKFDIHTRAFIGIVPNSKEHDNQRRTYLRKIIGDRFLSLGHPLSPPCEQITTDSYAVWGAAQLGRTKRVCQIVHRDTGGSYAGKYFLGDANKKAERERDILKTLKDFGEEGKDYYIIRTFGVETMYNRDRTMVAGDPALSARVPASCLLIMELCAEDLGTFDLRIWSQESMVKLLYQLCTGLRHIHRLGLIHGNIQPENILVKSLEPLDIKISGFGTAFPESSPLDAVVREALYKHDVIVTGDIEDQFSWNDTYIGLPAERPKRITDTTVWEQICDEVKRKGSIAMRIKDSPSKPVEDNWYRAPEMATKPSCKADIWSAGVIALQHHFSLDDLIARSMSKMVSFHDICYELRSRWIYARLLEYHVDRRLDASDACELFHYYLTKKKPSTDSTGEMVTPENLSQMSPQWGDDRDHDANLASGFTTPFYHYSSTPITQSPVHIYGIDDGASDEAMRLKFSPTRRRPPTILMPSSVITTITSHTEEVYAVSESGLAPPVDNYQSLSTPELDAASVSNDEDDETWEQLLPPSRPNTPQDQEGEEMSEALASKPLKASTARENTEATVKLPIERLVAETDVIQEVEKTKIYARAGKNSFISTDFTLSATTIMDEEDMSAPELTMGESIVDEIETIPTTERPRRRSVVRNYKRTQAANKEAYFEKLKLLLETYKSIFIVTVDNVSSQQMHEIRVSLRGEGVVLMGKNTMVRRAIRTLIADNPEYERLLPFVKGNVGFVFTNSDLKDIRDKILANRVAAPARAGAVAPVDVWVPAGNTGMEPGKTSFFQALGIPTKIARGTIEITTDLKLIGANNKVGASEATLLNLLNISPFTYGMGVAQIYDQGQVFAPSVLDIEEKDLLDRFFSAIKTIACVSLAVNYPTLVSVMHSLVNGYKNVLSVAIETDYEWEEIKELKDRIANPDAYASAAPAQADTKDDAPAEKKEEEEEEDEDDGDDDMLGGLF
ncbi:hypothetical protein ABW21_db0206360 [Orbilia brochopaga]|nr:hypothetical protein ABW21_db0206360 [Drechslerella brochopaga]